MDPRDQTKTSDQPLAASAGEQDAPPQAAAVRDEVTHLRAVVEAMTDGLVVYGPEGQATLVNRAARGLLALAGADDLVTRPLAPDTLRGRVVDAQGRPLPREQWPLYRILAGEVLGSEQAVDVHYQRRDGRTVIISVSGAPLRTADGQIRGAVTSLRDVTAQRQLEARTSDALQALLAMAEVLVQAPAEPAPAQPPEQAQPVRDETAQRLAHLTQRLLGCERLWMVTVDVAAGRQTPVAVAGLAEDQVQAWWTQTEQTPFADYPQFKFIAQLEAGEPLVIDLRQPPFSEPPLSEGPNPFGVRSALIAPMRVRGRLIGVLAYDYGPVEHDFQPQELALADGVAKLAALVLERERLLRERAAAQADALVLREANRRMDEFVGIVAHELRTPLTTVVTYLQIMGRQLEQAQARDDGALTGEDLRALFDRLMPALARSERQAQRLARLVADLLDLSRIQAGRLALRRDVMALVPLVREVIEEERQAHPDRVISLAVPVSAERLMVEADADRIGQVLTNFLTNALKYAPADRPVEVAVRREQGHIRVQVRDEGPGIPREEQEKVWDRFYRGAEAQAVSGSALGLGLGLHICKTIVERHGGQVGLRSVPGKGSTFWFTLPIASAGC